MQEPTVQEVNPLNYKDTLNLPQTAFKMKAGAATREVEIEQYWDGNQVYERLMESRKKAGLEEATKRFVLHDGPPYLSSDKIHIGTALNKILKDIITRYKSQQGLYVPYIPGYDGHGLPIETAVVKDIKGGRHAISEVELRKKCREFALRNLKGQEANFKRLGIWGDWKNPYITIDADFEATQIKVFGELYEKGFVYKGLKPVYWCPTCETALADAEVEYGDHVSHSIYVKFPVGDLSNNALPDEFKAMLSDASFVIWTTTPWTLPANLALSINPDFTYHLVKSRWGKLLIAEKLLPAFANLMLDEEERAEYQLIGSTDTFEAIAEFSGQELEGIVARHPFIDRGSPVLLGDHVTLDAGTGIVHTAPGHGMEDYLVVQKYNRDAFKDNPLPILSPLDNMGRFTAEALVPELVGVPYHIGNKTVLEILESKGALLHESKYSHSYPHCWRCHKPVIYRATEQWFIDIEQFRQDALKAIDTVEWLPERGRNRIYSMVEGRGDWCLSRQRVWGVPIPVMYCAKPDCRSVLLTPHTIDALYKQFKAHSSDIWWAKSADELLADLPVNERTCKQCGGTSFEKEMDIMDVWFDSGISHTAVVETRSDELAHLPADMYLEGSDQHRGWFQSALLTSVMLYNKAPYRSVLTHGFVLDENGRKMSKSLGNVVDPNSVIREYGADVLRLWVASVDYTSDVRIGKNTLHQMAEIYRKVRNTVRFILGNLYDFDPAKDAIPYEQLSMLDHYTLHRLHHILNNITDAFEKWEFYRYCHEIQYLCMADLSQLYFDVTKDILYCDAPNAPRRRAVQTVLYEILSVILPVLVPVTPHLAEDIWLSLPEHQRMIVNGEKPVSAVMLPWPAVNQTYLNPQLAETFEALLAIKETVNQSLETPRSEGHIGSSLEAVVAVQPKNEDTRKLLEQFSTEELAVLFITSGVSIVTTAPAPEAAKWQAQAQSDAVKVYALPSEAQKCIRCWKYEPSVGSNPKHPEICERCNQAVSSL
jgi:isoleucyl-tRNA synthetase